MSAAGQPSDPLISANACSTPSSARVTAPSRLASRLPSGLSASGTWAYTGCGWPSKCGQVGLAGGGREQVVAAHHLVDAGQCVVDHHGEVVGGNAVAAAQHEVVDHAGIAAVHQVGHRVLGDLGAQPQRRRSSVLPPKSAFSLGEVPARSGVGALQARAVPAAR